MVCVAFSHIRLFVSCGPEEEELCVVCSADSETLMTWSHPDRFSTLWLDKRVTVWTRSDGGLKCRLTWDPVVLLEEERLVTLLWKKESVSESQESQEWITRRCDDVSCIFPLEDYDKIMILRAAAEKSVQHFLLTSVASLPVVLVWRCQGEKLCVRKDEATEKAWTQSRPAVLRLITHW